MSEKHLYPVPADVAARAYVDNDKYLSMYKYSVEDPEGFWGEHGKRLDWFSPYTKVKDVSYDLPNVHVKWYEDGTLNASHNCLDRHLATRGDQTAIIWEGDDPKEDRKLTYRELHEQVCKFANGLKSIGAKKGDRITIYMPMIPEAAVAMLACARIGAVHSVVFGGFSPDALAGRIHDCESNIVITADEGIRAGRKIPLKANTDAALKTCPTIKTCVVVRAPAARRLEDGRDVWYHDLSKVPQPTVPAEVMNAEDPLFILYTSGSTGKPKGVLHTTGGYMVYASMTHQYVFDYHDGDIYWCTADVGWVTGHSYIMLWTAGQWRHDADVRRRAELSGRQPLLAGLRQAQGQYLLHRANRHPRPDARRQRAGHKDQPQIDPRCWVRLANRSIRKPGNGITCRRRGTLPDRGYLVADRNRRHPDYAAARRDHAETGFSNRPFFGIVPAWSMHRAICWKAQPKAICVSPISWPGQMRTCYGDHDRFVDAYFKDYPGTYFTGDGVRRDADGYYWITGRVDDVINVPATAWVRRRSNPLWSRTKACRRSRRRRLSA